MFENDITFYTLMYRSVSHSIIFLVKGTRAVCSTLCQENETKFILSH